MAAAGLQHATIIVYYRDNSGNFQILSGLGHSWVSDDRPDIVNYERVTIDHGSKYDIQENAIRYFKQVLDKYFPDSGYKFEKPKKKFIEGKGERWTTKFYKASTKISLPKGGREPCDINLEVTARRELREETSIGGSFELLEIPELISTTKVFLLPLVRGSKLFTYVINVLETRRNFMGELFELGFRDLTILQSNSLNFITRTILNHRDINTILGDKLREVEERGERGTKRGREDRGSSGDKKARRGPSPDPDDPAASGAGGPAASGAGGPAASGAGGSRKYIINYYK